MAKADTDMTWRYGRAPQGQRARAGTPAGRWRTLTILGAIRRSGWAATMTIEAATDGEIFLADLEQVLCPQLEPGDVVVLDNLAAAQGPGRARTHQTAAAHRHCPFPVRAGSMPRRSPGRSDSTERSGLLPPLRLRSMIYLRHGPY
ncbi:MAG: transposase [Candidatus Solibacter usitatus]|nr:transposase [Candidatus Solibacter usitatus]